MKIYLKIWRQKDAGSKGAFVDYVLNEVLEDMSILEMLDVLNEKLISEGVDPIAFDHDCREGICGTCSLTINGVPHGPEKATTTCQLHMRKFHDGETVTVEPFRSKAFPVLKDLVVDRSSFDRIIQAGGFVSVNTGSAPDANAIPIAKKWADLAMDAAACIGCGACVAACPNGAAMLFVSAKISQLAYLPQGQAERKERAIAMINQMDKEGFGACTNYYECEAACPKEVSVRFIAKMNKEFMAAKLSLK
jgi:succinate dehydrogenase / fumarate reductase iron-sulfur subunit